MDVKVQINRQNWGQKRLRSNNEANRAIYRKQKSKVNQINRA